MSSFKKRVKKLEEKIKGKGGTADWALEAARNKAFFDDNWHNTILAMNESARIHCNENPKDPKPPELQTEEDILKFAKEISDKFSNLEEYQAYRQSQIDWTEIDKAIKRL